MMCLHSVGLKKTVQVDVEDKEVSDCVFWCTRVIGVEEADEGGGLVGSVVAISTSITIAAVSF